MTKFFGAMLRDVSSLHREESIAHKGGNVKESNVIEAPKVREILTKLRQARDQHCANAAENVRADSEAGRLALELSQAVAQRDAKEKAMAIAGDVPEEAFPEELQVARATRQHRVALARVAVMKERVAASQQVVDDLNAQVDAALLEVGTEAVGKLIERFRMTAITLRKIHCEHRAWLQFFSNKPGIIGTAHAKIIDPMGNVCPGEIDGCRVVDGRLFDSLLYTDEGYWRPHTGDLIDAIQALHTEVKAAKGE